MNLAKQISTIESDISQIKNLLTNQGKKEILTAEEVLTLLNIKRTTFNQWRSYGLLKVYKINRRLYCKYSEILESLENGIIEQKSQ